MIFYAFTQQNLDIWSTLLDCPSKIKVANESLAAAMVEAVECLLSKLCKVIEAARLLLRLQRLQQASIYYGGGGKLMLFEATRKQTLDGDA